MRTSRNEIKVMEFTRNKSVTNITLDGENLQQMEEFCYLDSAITEDGRK